MRGPDVEAPGTVAAGRAQVESQSNSIVAPGSLPKRTNTVIAEVLSRTLSGQALTGIAGVMEASTTRLAAHIGDLEKRYGWTFDRRDKVNGCSDGRVVTIVEYSLAPEVIEAAMKDGGAAWCKTVQSARRALRANADRAKLQAATANAAAAQRRRTTTAPGQADLFGGAQ